MFHAKNLGPFKISLTYLRTEQVAFFSHSLALPLCLSGELRPTFTFSCSCCKKWWIVTMAGKGRKKVENKLIEKASSRMVCFSKRRKGLFKKAEELSILCGAKIAVLAFSQAGKLYCSDAKTMDSLLCPQVENSSEIQKEDDWHSAFAEARAADNLLCPQFEMPLENALDSSFAGAMVEEPFSSDVPTPNSLLCPQLNICTENDAEDVGWNYAFTEAMDGNLYCSDAKTMDSLLCPQVDNSSEIQSEDDWNSAFAEATAADSLLCPQFVMPLENALDSSFAGAMVEEHFSSDVPTPNSLLFPQLNISAQNDAQDDGWNYAFTEAMDGNLYFSDAATLNPLLCPQFNISTEQEEENCWEFDFAEAMAGKELPFWYNRANVQAMGCEELRRLERAIWDYGQMQFAKNCYR